MADDLIVSCASVTANIASARVYAALRASDTPDVLRAALLTSHTGRALLALAPGSASVALILTSDGSALVRRRAYAALAALADDAEASHALAAVERPSERVLFATTLAQRGRRHIVSSALTLLTRDAADSDALFHAAELLPYASSDAVTAALQHGWPYEASAPVNWCRVGTQHPACIILALERGEGARLPLDALCHAAARAPSAFLHALTRLPGSPLAPAGAGVVPTQAAARIVTNVLPELQGMPPMELAKVLLASGAQAPGAYTSSADALRCVNVTWSTQAWRRLARSELGERLAERGWLALGDSANVASLPATVLARLLAAHERRIGAAHRLDLSLIALLPRDEREARVRQLVLDAAAAERSTAELASVTGEEATMRLAMSADLASSDGDVRAAAVAAAVAGVFRFAPDRVHAGLQLLHARVNESEPIRRTILSSLSAHLARGPRLQLSSEQLEALEAAVLALCTPSDTSLMTQQAGMQVLAACARVSVPFACAAVRRIVSAMASQCEAAGEELVSLRRDLCYQVKAECWARVSPPAREELIDMWWDVCSPDGVPTAADLHADAASLHACMDTSSMDIAGDAAAARSALPDAAALSRTAQFAQQVTYRWPTRIQHHYYECKPPSSIHQIVKDSYAVVAMRGLASTDDSFRQAGAASLASLLTCDLAVGSRLLRRLIVPMDGSYAHAATILCSLNSLMLPVVQHAPQLCSAQLLQAIAEVQKVTVDDEEESVGEASSVNEPVAEGTIPFGITVLRRHADKISRAARTWPLDVQAVLSDAFMQHTLRQVEQVLADEDAQAVVRTLPSLVSTCVHAVARLPHASADACAGVITLAGQTSWNDYAGAASDMTSTSTVARLDIMRTAIDAAGAMDSSDGRSVTLAALDAKSLAAVSLRSISSHARLYTPTQLADVAARVLLRSPPLGAGAQKEAMRLLHVVPRALSGSILRDLASRASSLHVHARIILVGLLWVLLSAAARSAPAPPSDGASLMEAFMEMARAAQVAVDTVGAKPAAVAAAEQELQAFLELPRSADQPSEPDLLAGVESPMCMYTKHILLPLLSCTRRSLRRLAIDRVASAKYSPADDRPDGHVRTTLSTAIHASLDAASIDPEQVQARRDETCAALRALTVPALHPARNLDDIAGVVRVCETLLCAGIAGSQEWADGAHMVTAVVDTITQHVYSTRTSDNEVFTAAAASLIDALLELLVTSHLYAPQAARLALCDARDGARVMARLQRIPEDSWFSETAQAALEAAQCEGRMAGSFSKVAALETMLLEAAAGMDNAAHAATYRRLALSFRLSDIAANGWTPQHQQALRTYAALPLPANASTVLDVYRVLTTYRLSRGPAGGGA